MVAPLLTALPLLTLLAAPGAPDSAARDTSHRAPRIVRQFPAIEVRAPLHDLGSSEAVHLVTPAALRDLPADNLADAVRTQAGVIADGEELHVRGGRAGELDQVVDGVTLNEPLDRRPMNIPLLALRSLELIDGGQDAEYGGALAGILQMRTENPTARWSTAWKYSTDAGLDTHYDQMSLRGGGPIGLGGLGLVSAGDVMGDDTWLPNDRTLHHRNVLGLRLGWRAENRLLGWAKLAPLADPQRGSLQVFASREVHEPSDPAWTKEGWYTPCADPESCARQGWTETPPDTSSAAVWTHYKAADHLAIVDERRVATILTLARSHADRRGSLTLGWIHDRSVRSPNGQPGDAYLYAPGGPAVLGVDGKFEDPFYVYFGNDPLYREAHSTQLSLRGDQVWAPAADHTLRAGFGLTYDDVSLHEVDATTFGLGLDSLRDFHAWAPGGFAYAQTRWRHEGMVLNLGLRAQVFTAGPRANGLPGEPAPRAQLALSPRLGIAYPISTRDVFSLSYVRLEQDPARDFLYDSRQVITNREPLGNPLLEPSKAISYQGALKHLFSATWAAQLGVFYRDVFGQVGARSVSALDAAYLRYTNDDESHALGFELSLLHEADRRHAELHYTWMQAYGSESRPQGDPYGFVLGPRTPPIDDRPLSWDRRHTVAANGTWPLFERWVVSWSSVVGAPLPWTPKTRRDVVTDPAVVNSARLEWDENTDVTVRWDPPILPIPLTFGLEVRNLFDHRGERWVTVDGYPHALINTVYDDYGAYRTESGQPGGAYWLDAQGRWIPVHDPRLDEAPRRVRVSIGARW